MDKKTIFVFKGILIDDKNNVLIDNRKEERLDIVNGRWEVPGGKIEFGESPEDAVKRELLEETGYNVNVLNIIPYSKISLWEYSNFIQHTVMFFYICELKDEKHLEIQDKRINEYKWVNFEELDQYEFLPGNKEAIKIALKIKLGGKSCE